MGDTKPGETSQDRTAWVVEAAGKLMSWYAGEEARHLEHGPWQLSVLDALDDVPGSVRMAGASTTLGRTSEVLAYPATDDRFAALHLYGPVPIEASGVVVLRHALVGVDPDDAAALTVLPRPVDGEDEGAEPTFPVVPALVAYAVPRDEEQDAQVLFRPLCTVDAAQRARLIPSPLSPYQASVVNNGPRGASALLRRLPATAVAHDPVEGAGPVPALRFAMTGHSGLVEPPPATLERVRTAIAAATLAETLDLLPSLDDDEAALCWGSSVEAAREALRISSWEELRADQAGSRLHGAWVPRSVAQLCTEAAMFADVAATSAPDMVASVRRLLCETDAARFADVVEVFAGRPRMLAWFRMRHSV